MSTSDSSNQRSHSIGQAFMKVFETTKQKLEFHQCLVDSLEDGMLGPLVQAAVSKCIDFNMIVNRLGKGAEEAFFFMSNLRGICEDLIYLTYLSRMEAEPAEKLIRVLTLKNNFEGRAIQREFFSKNNPLQPVLGGDNAAADGLKSREEFRQFWKLEGINRPPTMRDMAEQVGLISTYDFIYFAASNFVHFNPLVLLRTGWANENDRFVFSTRHMHAYYRDFSGFYGAVLFIGFHASFGAKYFKVAVDSEVDRLVKLIGHVQRWPEIVTFEEMNVQPPLYMITHALRQVVEREEWEAIPYGAILEEIQGLRR